MQVTDATACTQEELEEAIQHFLTVPLDRITFTRTKGGVNNKVYYVQADGASYVLRCYNNGCNNPRVQYEHAVLHAVRAVTEGKEGLAFRTPYLVPSLKDGASHVQLKSGADACLFERIQGGPASAAHARSMGKATAQLVSAMAGVAPPSLPLPNPLYRNIYDAHHKMNRDLFFKVMASSDFDGVKEARDYLVAAVERAEGLVARIMALDPPLPEQMIHADLHGDNVLVDPETGEVTGLLDFEFCAPDWRVMELCVGVSKFVGVAGIEPTIEAWVAGYAEGGGKLTATEIELVPELIELRVLSNVVYFAGRAAAGEDVIDALTTRAVMYANRCKWLTEKAVWMRGVLSAALL